MAIIQTFLRKDMQNFGFIKVVDNKPFYSYPSWEATKMPVDEAIKLVSKLSNKYFFKIHRDKSDVKKCNSNYIIVDKNM